MAKYSSSDFTVQVDNSSGSLVTLTAYITAVSTFTVEASLTDSTTMGDSWQESLATGLRNGSELTISGLFDDTSSTGPDAVLNAPFSGPAVSTRSVVLTWGGSKTSSFEAIIKSYQRSATANDLSTFECVLVPTGAVTEA